MNTDKMDTSAIFEMFETIIKKFDKQTDKPNEPVKIDMMPVNALTEHMEDIIKEVKNPAKVEHQHCHTIDIGSSKIFISLVVMAFATLGLSYFVGEQRRSINKYRENDLKYRYIKMHGQTNIENLYRLERQFRNGDSIKIIRKQIEKYEELVKEQAERMERVRQNSEEMERLRKEAEKVREQK